MGIDKSSGQNRGERWPADRSGGGGRCDPNAIGIGSKETKSGSADHVSLGVEGVVDGGVGGNLCRLKLTDCMGTPRIGAQSSPKVEKV